MAVDCPHCGWQTELSVPEPARSEEPAAKKRRALGWKMALILVFSTATAIGLSQWQKGKAHRLAPSQVISSSNSTVIAKTAAGPNFSTNDLSISSITLEKAKAGSVVYAVGTIKNELDRQRFGVRVELDLFDGDGVKIGTAPDYLSILEPKKEWRFKALVLEKKATSAKLAAIKSSEGNQVSIRAADAKEVGVGEPR